jgi:aminopeptidase N
LPLKAALVYGNEKMVIDWNVNKRRDTLRYAYKNGKRPVFIPDYTHVLPGEVKDGKKMQEWRIQYMQTDDYVSKRLAVSAACKLMSDTNSQAIIDLALADYIHSIRRYTLSQIKNTSNDKYRKRWEDYVISVAKYDSDKLVRAEAFNVLGEWKVSSAKGEMLRALRYSSYAIAGAALSALNKIDKDTAYVLAKDLLNTDPKSSLESAVWSIICKKGADEDIVLIEKHAPYVFGTKRFALAFSLSSYLKNVKSDASFRRGIEVYVTLVVTEEMKSYRSMLAGYLFQVASDQKDNLKSDNKEEAETAKKRYDLMKPMLQRMVDAETDPENAKENNKKMKEIFE